MPSQPATVARPCRFRRISVRSLLVLVLLVALCLGWIARSARIQREAIAGIKENGGTVFHDHAFFLQISFDHGSILQYGELTNRNVWPPRWLVAAIGVDYFANATDVFLHGPSDEALSHVEKLGRVQRIHVLNNNELTDASLAHFSGLSHLLELDLSHAGQVGDAGISHLKNLKALRKLDLSSTRVTDAGLLHLAELTNLLELHVVPDLLNETELVESLGSHSENFTPYRAQVTDTGLAHLRGLTNLTTLDLNGTRVSDAGLIHLTSLIRLSSLSLEWTQVTDAGLVHLKSLSKLSKLDLTETRVTEAGIAELKRAMPNLSVKR